MTAGSRRTTRLDVLVAMTLACSGCAEPRADAGGSTQSPAGVAAESAGDGPRAPAWKTVELMDSAWPDAPMAFATIRIPADWQASGGIAALPRAPGTPAPVPQPGPSLDDPYASDASGSPAQCQATPLTCLDWSAARADGSPGIAILPSATWFVDLRAASAQAGPPASMARDALGALARQRHPDAREITFAPIDVPTPPDGGTAGFPSRWESGRMVVAYHADGRDMRAEWTTVLVISEAEALPGGGVRLIVSSNPPVAVHAEAAVFDALDRERIRTSLTMAPEWWARVGDMTRAREAARQLHACNQAIHHPRPPGCGGGIARPD
ncbi:MAG TPA: hypothetical protein VLK29_05665 [Luteimonas sp.]|nr:hypothetical protein [Luteimonas sp.]